MELLYAVIGAAIAIAFLHFLSSRPKKPEADPVLDQLANHIDSTLNGYPDRLHYRDVYSTDVWECHSQLFTLRIYLQKIRVTYRFTIFFSCKLRFQFKAKRSLTNRLKIIDSRSEFTKTLLAEKEIAPLLEKLRFYDSLEISSNGVRGSKSIRAVNDLSEWPRTLGESITFVRFLLNYQVRKEANKEGESICPYCRGLILDSEKAVSCVECRTVHHRDCWNETDRCSVFGCGNKSEMEL